MYNQIFQNKSKINSDKDVNYNNTISNILPSIRSENKKIDQITFENFNIYKKLFKNCVIIFI